MENANTDNDSQCRCFILIDLFQAGAEHISAGQVAQLPVGPRRLAVRAHTHTGSHANKPKTMICGGHTSGDGVKGPGWKRGDGGRAVSSESRSVLFLGRRQRRRMLAYVVSTAAMFTTCCSACSVPPPLPHYGIDMQPPSSVLHEFGGAVSLLSQWDAVPPPLPSHSSKQASRDDVLSHQASYIKQYACAHRQLSGGFPLLADHLVTYDEMYCDAAWLANATHVTAQHST